MDDFSVYMPETWQSDGMTVYCLPVPAHPAKRNVRGSAWMQVVASSAIGLAVALTALPVQSNLSEASLSFPLPNDGSVPTTSRFETVLMALERRDIGALSSNLLLLAEDKVARNQNAHSRDELDSWAANLSRDVANARD